jgi:ribonuclease III
MEPATWQDRLRASSPQIGHPFGNLALLEEALTHSSYCNESGRTCSDNERLEFLGDSVLSCALSHMIWETFPNLDEGELTQRRAWLVSEHSLAHHARVMGLGALLRLGRGEDANGGRNKPSILADTFEAVLAAVYLDGGYAVAQALVERVFRGALLEFDRHAPSSNYKSKVQERVQAEHRLTPRYRVVGESGPDHKKVFEVALILSGQEVSTGAGRSKKEAEESAARELWLAMEADPRLLSDYLRE